jgi:uncharacterized protein (TIGR02246 family)
MSGDIAAIFDAYGAAVWARDADAFLALYAPEVRIFDTWGTWSHEGVEAWGQSVRGWLGALGNERVAVTVDDISIVDGSDLAAASACVTYAAIAPDGKRLRAMQNRLSWVLARRDGAWLIVHEHTSVPVGHDDLKGILQRP